jgi:arylsulfatase A-like enzyme
MISRRDFLKYTSAAAAVMAAGCGEPLVSTKKRRPNIIWILADDLGYGDVGFNGNTIVKTPNLDRLASQGVRLTDFYVTTPVCSPSRGALLTGRYPQRNGLTNVIEVKDRTTHLPTSEVLVSQLLKQQGYRTGIIGKWHIGEPEAALPNSRGFDHFFGSPLGGIDFFSHQWMDGTHALYENGKPVYRPGEFMTDILGDEAVKFIDSSKDEPFFLYLSFFAVHTAMGSESKNELVQSPQRWVEPYVKAGLTERDARLAGCTSTMDEAIGKVLAKLKDLGLEDDTFVVFTSDNGPDPREAGTAWPCSGTKHQMWEGGCREPAIVRWPGRIPAGQDRQAPMISLDMVPTALRIAEADKPDDLVLDGIDVLDYLTGNRELPARDLYFSYIRESYGGSREKAVRRGRWVWLNGELFDINADIAQQHDISDKYPFVAGELESAWNKWLSQFPAEQKRWNGKDVKPKETQVLREWGLGSENISR